MYQENLEAIYNRVFNPDYIAFSQTKRSKEISAEFEKAFAEYKENKYNPAIANEKLQNELNELKTMIAQLISQNQPVSSTPSKTTQKGSQANG